MGALTSTWPTLLDVSRSMAPDGSVAQVAEVLQTYNDILDDIPWYEGNLPTGHQSSIRTSLPTPKFRLLNAGIVPAKTTRGMIVDPCAILEDRSHIDVDLAMLNGNTAAFRKSEDEGFIQGFNKTFTDTLIYGDVSTDPEQFNGFDSRYYSLSGEATSGQVITAGSGTTTNTSIYLVGWGPNKVFCTYPKGSKAGLQFEDQGIQMVTTDTAGSYMRAYVSWFQWKAGLVVADYRYVVRIANINAVSLLTASDATDTSANIMKLMSRAIGLLPPMSGVRPVFYMNQTVLSMLAIKMMDKGNVWLSMNEMKNLPVARSGSGVLSFLGVPCRRCDSILNTEGILA
ncbi:MAG: hypothetical protein EOM59_10790 [Clostridia bacterium]|nr:hypothetical protein [Clostridia bacterium]